MPCCGATAADVAGMYDEAAAFRAAPGGSMAKLFSARTGHSLQVVGYGVATNDEGLTVPAAVAFELEQLVEDGVPVYRAEYEPGEREAAEAAASAQESVATPTDGDAGEPTDEEDGPGEIAAAYHAEGGKVWHDNASCRIGNDIEPENRREGKGKRLRYCPECKSLASASTGE